jgi:hypothetical protein
MEKQVRFTDGELARLRAGIRGMSRESRLYRLLRDELKARGNWKQAARNKLGGKFKPEYRGIMHLEGR